MESVCDQWQVITNRDPSSFFPMAYWLLCASDVISKCCLRHPKADSQVAYVLSNNLCIFFHHSSSNLPGSSLQLAGHTFIAVSFSAHSCDEKKMAKLECPFWTASSSAGSPIFALHALLCVHSSLQSSLHPQSSQYFGFRKAWSWLKKEPQTGQFAPCSVRIGLCSSLQASNSR